MNNQEKSGKAVVLKKRDRAKILGKIPKPGDDFGPCCYTSCTRC